MPSPDSSGILLRRRSARKIGVNSRFPAPNNQITTQGATQPNCMERSIIKLANSQINNTMELPKFLLGDNTDFPEDIFIIHLDYPRFIINLKDDEVEFLEEVEDLDETELNAEMEGLIEQANAFYDREVQRYEE